jgi:SAM-dependent methyltransferase
MKLTPHQHVALSEWYESPLGQHLLAQLKKPLDDALSTCFGYYALHIGCENLSPTLFEQSRIKHVFRLGSDSRQVDALVEKQALPIASDSTDLVVLMHTLSQSRDPHAILREVNRVLIADGKLVIIDFNPVSLWGLRHLLQGWLDDAPWAGHYYTARRLQDWLRLLGFEMLNHTRSGHILPLQHQNRLTQSRLFNKFTRRWINFSAALNMMVFEKKIIPLTPARKRWAKRQILAPKVARPTVGRGMKYDK